jgi:hypothetical protein
MKLIKRKLTRQHYIFKIKGVLKDEEKSEIKKNAIAFCSMFVALLSLAFTIWQGDKIREYYSLSMTPKVQFSYINFTDSKDFQIAIRNDGVGPAIVDDIIYKSKNAKEYSVKNLKGKFWYKIFKDNNMSESAVYEGFLHYIIPPGAFMPIKEGKEFFRVIHSGLSTEEYNKAMGVILNGSLYIKYHSLYGKSFTDSLTHFETVNYDKL